MLQSSSLQDTPVEMCAAKQTIIGTDLHLYERC